MIRSMFTAIGSLNLHQIYMDVVADNLANANTVGFKSSRMTFQNQFAQLLQSGSASTAVIGGMNPAQVGLGSRLGSITANFVQGMLQSTGRNSDLAIQGDGFFIYEGDAGANLYSRDGTLQIDANGFLVNAATGQRIQGWQAVLAGGNWTVDTGSPLSAVQLPLGATIARATTTANMAGNLDSTTAIGDSYDVTLGAYDSLGNPQTVTLTFTRTSDTTWDVISNGATVGTVTFDADGQYSAGSGSVTIPGANGAAATTITLDLTGLTQLATESSAATFSQDGLGAGSFSSFYVTPDTGEIYGVYSNGMQQLIGQLALANFTNPTGLVRAGQNMFAADVNSGEPIIGGAGTGGRGYIASGYLENSNVDLGREFTNMILAQRGFQASSRVITTSDEMLQELVNLKR